MTNFAEMFTAFATSFGGKAVLVIVAIVLLMLGVKSTSKSREFNTKVLIYSALGIALATVLSNITVYKMPMGGTVTAMSMLFIVLIGYWFGPVQGILCGLTYGVIQIVLGAYVVHPIQLVLDYFIAFGMLGLSGFFRKGKRALVIGYSVAVFGRFVAAVISGYVFFGSYAEAAGFESELLYAMAYNATYLVPEAIVTLLVLNMPTLKHAIDTVGRKAMVSAKSY